MAGNSFGNQVRAFAEETKARQEAIFKASSARVLELANTPEAQGGRMPVDTGFLRNSNVASTSGMPGAGGEDPPLVFARMKVGDTVSVGWTAAYALRQEHGFMGEDSLGREYAQQGKGFLRIAVQNWPFIVAEVAAEQAAANR